MPAIALVGARIIDGTGAQPLPDGALIVQDGKVAAVGEAADVQAPAEAEVVDAAGLTVMPGLIDCHQHVGFAFAALHRLQQNLRRGTTTVAGVTSGPAGVELRTAIEKRLVDRCPRYWVGAVVGATGGHLRRTDDNEVGATADGPWEIRRAVREMSMMQVDFIKTAASGGFQWPNEQVEHEDYTVEELCALAHEARSRGKRVIVHAHSQPGLNHAIEAGCEMIHHGALIDDEALEGILREGLYYAPTLHITSEQVWSKESLPAHMRERMSRAHPVHREGVRKAHAMGIHLSVGTDGGPGDAAHEMMELCACGLSPLEAITCATHNSAEALGILDRTGTLEAGKDADLILVEGDPLDDIAVLYRPDSIRLVMRAGRVEFTDEDFKRHWHPDVQ